MKHPRDVLLGAQAAARALPVCDHYSGVEARMRKSLQLQAELHQEFGVGVMDVTLDCEDGAPVGGEAEHALLVTELALAADPLARVAVRVHAVGHPAFEADIQTMVGLAAGRWCHIMLPKAETVADIHTAVHLPWVWLGSSVIPWWCGPNWLSPVPVTRMAKHLRIAW